jgi:hypothetical protein
MTDAPPEELTASVAPPPIRRRRSRPAAPTGTYQDAFWFAVLLATALTLGGAAVAVGAYTADAQPDTVVRAYFAALRRGDAAGALGYGTVPAGPGGLLGQAVLAAQRAAGPIEGLVVRGVRRSGDTAEVSITYTVDLRSGPAAVSDTVPVVRHGHGWRLVRSAVLERIRPGSGSVLAAVAGSAVPSGEFPMFPGAVPVGYDSPNLEPAPESRVVRFAGSGSLPVNAAVSAAGRAAIAPAVRVALAACLAGRSATQPLCPLPDAAAGVPGTLRGRVTGPVSLSFQVDTVDGEIGVHGTAPVVGTYQHLDDNNIVSRETVRSTGLNAHCAAATPGTLRWDAS